MAPNNYSQYMTTLFTGDSFWDIIYNMVTVYSAVTGDFIFWSFMIMIAFIPTYIMTDSIIIPCTTYLFVGGFLAVFAPPELSMPMYIISLIGVVGVMYHFFVKR